MCKEAAITMNVDNIHLRIFTVLLYGLFSTVNGQYDSSEEIDSRIIGGLTDLEGEAFYQLALKIEGVVICGATLVLSPISSRQIALTAAHCVSNSGVPVAPEDLSLLGDVLNKYEGGQTRQVVKVVVHESFNFLFNDIAILFFDPPFDFTPTFKPVDLPDNATDDQTDTLTVSGWGRINDDEFSEFLQIVTIPVISNEICADWLTKHFKEREIIKKTSICGGLEEGGKDACQGDSGGPAVGKDSEGVFLAGIISFGVGCAAPRSPGVYTRVSQFLEWIAEHTSAIRR